MSRIEPGYDVVVVGARAAGAATAFLLARHGLRVLLVDRGRYGADTLSTHALMRGGVLQLTRWGLLDEIIAAGTPRGAANDVPVRRRPGAVTLKRSYGVEALYAPRRTVLDPILVDAAAAAGAEVRFGVAVTGVERDRHGTVTGITGRARDGETVRAAARIVVGADGIRSTVAEAVGAPYERVGRSVAAVTYGYWTGLETDGYEWNFRPDAASGVVPTNDGQACVFASASPRRIGRGGSGRSPASSPRRRETSRPGSPPPRLRPRCGPSPAGPVTSAGRGATAGRWSATPATSRTRSVRTG